MRVLKLSARGLLALAALLKPLTAAAAVVGAVATGDGTIDLHDTKGPCVGDALAAAYRPAKPGAEAISGCWVARAGFVFVVFMDADVARVPVAAVRKPGTT